MGLQGTVSSSCNKYVVIKYGGHLMGEDASFFAKQIVSLYRKNMAPVIVHGGAPEISRMLKRFDIQSEFIHGLRKTTRESLEVVQMVLCGLINKRVAASITSEGMTAIGIAGTDGALIKAMPLDKELGFVGKPVEVNTTLVTSLLENGIIPVIAPIGTDSSGQNYNINADTVAAAIAGALGARLLILTDVSGVMNQAGEIQHALTESEIHHLSSEGVIQNGMYPKVQACLDALKAGAQAAMIMNGRHPENIQPVLVDQKMDIGTHISLG